MAVTQIHPIETTLIKAIDYISNPDKTDGNLMISSFACSAETAAYEFDWTRKNGDKNGGYLGFHLIQSFAPGEVDYDTAHEIGKQLADKVFGGKFAFVIATHIDRGHVHNHIIANSVSFKDFSKYNSSPKSYYNIRRISDRLCHEHGLSVVEPCGDKGKSYKEYTADKQGMSWKSLLKKSIDECILRSTNWNGFLALMRENYEIKEGKHIAFRANFSLGAKTGHERFTRSKTLGAEYTEERIKERLQSITKAFSQMKNADNNINLLLDIENNIRAQQSAGFAHWSKIQHLKNAANTMNYLTENGILDYAVLSAKYEGINYKKDSAHDRIKGVEKCIKELDVLIKDIAVYRQNKPVIDRLDKVVFKDKYRREHETEFILFNAAEQSLKIHFKGGKLPATPTLRAELNQLYSEKNTLYHEFEICKGEFKTIQTIKQNADMILRRKSDLDKEKSRKWDGRIE